MKLRESYDSILKHIKIKKSKEKQGKAKYKKAVH